MNVLEKTTHPHITKIYEILEDESNFYVVMELLSGGSLLDKIILTSKFNEDHACMIIHQILLALNYMHSKHITHRDLKLENLMCVSKDPTDLTVKLTDFGFATFYDPNVGME